MASKECNIPHQNIGKACRNGHIAGVIIGNMLIKKNMWIKLELW